MLKEALNPLTRKIVFEYLHKLFPNTPIETLVLTVFSEVSRILCHNRVKVINKRMSVDTFPNFYGISFARSGSGKDLSIRNFRKMNSGVEQNMLDDLEAVYKIRKEKVMSDCANMKGTDRREFLQAHMPRAVKNEFSNATAEGVIADRLQMGEFGIGSLHFKNSEFVDYIMATTGEKESMLTLLKEVYDHGDNDAKLIKASKSWDKVQGVPQTMLVHSSAYGLNDKRADKFMDNFFARGMSRRSFVSFVDKINFTEFTTEELDEMLDAAFSIEQIVADNLKDIYSETKPGKLFINDNMHATKYFYFTEEAEKKMRVYKNECIKKAATESTVRNDQLIPEIEGRDWKAVKLSCIIAIMEGRKEITIDDVLYAIRITEYFGDQIVKLFTKENDVVKAYKLIKERGYVSTGYFFEQVFSKQNRNQFKRYIEDLEYSLSSYVSNKEEVLKVEPTKGGGKVYSIFSIKDTEITKDDNVVVKMSQITSPNPNIEKIPSPYKSIFPSFSILHDVITKRGTAYSFSRFRDEYRKQVNWLPEVNVIAFDFDNDKEKLDVKFEDVSKIFAGYTYMAITTKSHQGEKTMYIDKKTGKKMYKDRFRVLLPISSTTFRDVKEFKKYTHALIDYFDLIGVIDEDVTKDPARFFFPSPSDAKYEYGKGKLFNMMKLDIDQYEVEHKVHSRNNIRQFKISGTAKNVLDKNTLIRLPTGRSVDLKEMRSLVQQGRKNVVCFCPNHKDNTASAFGALADSGNLMICCSAGCGLVGFDK